MKRSCILLIALFAFHLLYAQKFTISGFIEDIESGERLLGASVYDQSNLLHGGVSNEFGFYSLTLPAGQVNLSCSYIGYAGNSIAIDLVKDTVINILLNPVIELEEVRVSSRRDPVLDNQIGLIEVPLETIKKLPVVFGEPDIMKSVQLMPGIKGGFEGSSGIYVRGGSPDQNLMLIDGVPVYNINHLFGFFSVFNSNAISNFDVIKGGFPARYGGHLSSVIDVRMKEGNMNERNTSFNIGLLSSSITTEGPIIKDKCSYMISGRRSYLDLIAVPSEWIYGAIKNNGERLTAGYNFGDINAKVNYKFSDKDRLYLSVFRGRDKLYANIKDKYFDGKESTSLQWGNMVSALRWNHKFSPRLFANTSLTYSQFYYDIGVSSYYKHMYEGNEFENENKVGYNSSINDLAIKTDFNYFISPAYTLRFGASAVNHSFNPGISVMKETYGAEAVGIDTSYGNKAISAMEYSGYFENEFKIGSRFSFNIGGRLSAFDIRDTLFLSPEPRISVRALVTDNFSLKASYSKMKQYVHLLTSSTVGFPTDIWVPATNKVLPQNSTQYSLSANFDLYNKYDLVIEGYYKDMNNLVEYKEGSSMFLDFDNMEVRDADLWEQKITQGKGWSYGAEVLFRKDYGKLNGWAAYTLAWANRQFDEIDNGRVFPYTYDRRHDIAIACTYKLNDRIDFGLNWVYSTGNVITLSKGNFITLVEQEQYYSWSGRDDDYTYYPNLTSYYENRNNFRMPAYHRLDLGINFTKEKKRGTRTLNVGIYNAYCHINSIMVEVWGNYENGEEVSRSVMAYGMFPIIPSVSYHFKFK